MQMREAVLGALKQLPWPEIPHGEEGLIESVWLLLTSVVTVPLVCKLPGGSPVLGFLVRPVSGIHPTYVHAAGLFGTSNAPCNLCLEVPTYPLNTSVFSGRHSGTLP